MEMIVPQVQLQASSAHQLRNAEKLSTHGLNQNLSSLGCAAEYISLVLLGMQVYAMSSKLFRKNLHNAEGKGESVP